MMGVFSEWTVPERLREFLSVLRTHPVLKLNQRTELGEVLLGFETRNRYVIEDAAGIQVGYAAEGQKGFWGFLGRTVLGHWRRFDITIFDRQRVPQFRIKNAFRWFFPRIEVLVPGEMAQEERLGAIEARFAFFAKKFDVLDAQDRVRLRVRSPIWKPWTFPFVRAGGQEAGRVTKQWSGMLSEAFTDRDRFHIEFGADVDDAERLLLIAAGLYVDLQYFEKKARS